YGRCCLAHLILFTLNFDQRKLEPQMHRGTEMSREGNIEIFLKKFYSQSIYRIKFNDQFPLCLCAFVSLWFNLTAEAEFWIFATLHAAARDARSPLVAND